MLFSCGLRWVFTQRRGVSLETGKRDPWEPERNLDTQRGVCRLGHLSSRSQTRCSKNEVTKTQGGLEVCSIAAAKRKGNPAPYQASTVALPPQVSALHLFKPAVKTMSDSTNRGCYRPLLMSRGLGLAFCVHDSSEHLDLCYPSPPRYRNQNLKKRNSFPRWKSLLSWESLS